MDLPVEDAYRLFTASFAEWWPGDDSERRAAGRGSVTVWNPPDRIEYSWRRDDNQTVNVEFRVEADGTRVTLTHHNWQLSGMATCFGGFARSQMLAAV